MISKSNSSHASIDNIKGTTEETELSSLHFKTYNSNTNSSITYIEGATKNLSQLNKQEVHFAFKSNNFTVPESKLQDPNAFENIDLTYFFTKCREILKKIYDQNFKNHTIYQDL